MTNKYDPANVQIDTVTIKTMGDDDVEGMAKATAYRFADSDLVVIAFDEHFGISVMKGEWPWRLPYMAFHSLDEACNVAQVIDEFNERPLCYYARDAQPNTMRLLDAMTSEQDIHPASYGCASRIMMMIAINYGSCRPMIKNDLKNRVEANSDQEIEAIITTIERNLAKRSFRAARVKQSR